MQALRLSTLVMLESDDELNATTPRRRQAPQEASTPQRQRHPPRTPTCSQRRRTVPLGLLLGTLRTENLAGKAAQKESRHACITFFFLHLLSPISIPCFLKIYSELSIFLQQLRYENMVLLPVSKDNFFAGLHSLPPTPGTMHIEDIRRHPHVTINAGPTAQDNSGLMHLLKSLD